MAYAKYPPGQVVQFDAPAAAVKKFCRLSQTSHEADASVAVKAP
jgi:hypothetical protein